jgi:hypothetical protein
MEYPHPRTTVNPDGTISVDDAYDRGIGRWDEIAIMYGYSDFPDGTDEAAALEAIIQEGIAEGTTFRPNQGVHPQTGLWDNGENLATELDRMMDVRRIALDRFGEATIRNGKPLAMMEDVFVPLYLHHRYQVESSANILGGQYYTFAMRGDGQTPVRRVPAGEQRQALDALLRTLDPEELAVPAAVRDNLPPRPGGYLGGNELFGGWTGPIFDAIAPAATAASVTLGQLMDPSRAARLVQQNAVDPSLPGLDDVLGAVEDRVFVGMRSDPYLDEISRAVWGVYVDALMDLASSNSMPQVQAIASLRLRDLGETLANGAGGRDGAAMSYLLSRRIDSFLDRPMPADAPPAPAPGAPPGSPIGDPGMIGAPRWDISGLAPAVDPFGFSAISGLRCDWL